MAKPINIGRPGPWGNPFVVGIHGSREDCIQLFENWLQGKDYRPVVASMNTAMLIAKFDWMRAHILELDGQTLWCPGCRGTSPCHGDVLKQYLREELGIDDNDIDV